jgi:transmembrane sensor
MLVLMRPEAAAPPSWYATGAGQTRQIALADGSRIALSASTRLGVAAKGQAITLAGAASFDVPHRADRVLTVRAGDVEISDIGTRFEVSTAPGIVRIAVAEGRLTARLGDGQTIPVTAGSRLLIDTGRASADLAPLEPGAFAAWRSGRLVYQNAPLSLVSADVGRYAGSDIRMDPYVASRRFSGILTIGNGSGLVRNLAQIMDLDVRAEGKAVRLLPHAARRAGARPGR